MSSTDDLLFAETDGGCAYCGMRDSRVLTSHHLVQASPKNEDYDNKIVLCHNCHHAHHAGKGATADELQMIKRRLIIKTLTTPGHNALKLGTRQGQLLAAPFLVLHLVELQLIEKLRVSEQWIEDESSPERATDIENVYRLTERGRAFVEKWKLK